MPHTNRSSGALDWRRGLTARAVAAVVAVAGLVLLLLRGCGGGSGSAPAPIAGASDAGTDDVTVEGSVDAMVDSPADGPTFSIADGWHRWAVAPSDCAVFVPDDIKTVPRLVWDPCPFMASGCTMAPATWAPPNWPGYAHAITVQQVGGHTQLGFTRTISTTDEETIIEDIESGVIAAWRVRVPDSRCALEVPRAWKSTWGVELLRADKETSPLFLQWDAAVSPTTAPAGEIDVLAVTPGAVLPSGRFRRTDSILLLGESYGRFFAYRFSDGASWRPKPDVPFESLSPESPSHDNVFFELYNFGHSEIWRWSPTRGPEPLMSDSIVSYGLPDATEDKIGWGQGVTFDDVTFHYADVTVWSASLDAAGDLSAARQLDHRTDSPMPWPSMGDTWLAAMFGTQDVMLYSTATGEKKVAPPPGEGSWNSSSSEMVERDGVFWVITNGKYQMLGAQYIVRIDIASLPPD